jgi:adenylate cyclase class 2
MAIETEIKLRIADVKALRRKLRQIGAKPAFAKRGPVHERNVIFDTADLALAGRGELVRIRQERGGLGWKQALLTFKGPVANGPSRKEQPITQRHKVREEIELEVSAPETLAKILERLGLKGWFQYEKFRTTFRLPVRCEWARGLLIELDDTPIGVFVELEGSPKAIDRAARELGFSPADYLQANYLTLYREDCKRRGVNPSNMLFPKGKKSGSLPR